MMIPTFIHKLMFGTSFNVGIPITTYVGLAITTIPLWVELIPYILMNRFSMFLKY